MTSGFFFTLLAPMVWGVMNVLDKYVIAHRVKSALGFTTVAAAVNLGIGVIFALCTSWTEVQLYDLSFPIAAGVLFAFQMVIYYLLMQKEDAANVVGLAYFYPLLVAFLSYFILGEIIAWYGYIGMAAVIIGVMLLSLRLHVLGLRAGLLLLIANTFATAAYEFLIKIAASHVSSLQGIALNQIAMGCTVLLLLLFKSVRKAAGYEYRKNWLWALLNETLTCFAIFFTYLAMKTIPVTIVTSVGAMQPLVVVGVEYFVSCFVPTIVRDKLTRYKWIAAILIVIGVILLSLSQNH